MSSLYTKYRPSVFSDMFGQDHIVNVLKAQIANNKIGHSYLFTGPRGCGKTSCARIFAKAVNCKKHENGECCNTCQSCNQINNGSALDIVEIDAASNRSIDDIRDFKEKISFLPVELKYRVIIIDEVHMLTKEAFNALLKTLEEPPSHVIIILATTEVHKLPQTIISRCIWFQFKLAKIEVKTKVLNILKNENINLDDRLVDIIVAQGGGSFRDTESILEKYMSGEGNIEGAMLIESMCNEYISLLKSKSLSSLKQYVDKIQEYNIDLQTLISRTIDTLFLTSEEDFSSLDFVLSLHEIIKRSLRPYLTLYIETFKFIGNNETSQHTVTKSERKESIPPVVKQSVVLEKKKELKQLDKDVGSDLDITSVWIDIVTDAYSTNPQLSAYISNSKPKLIDGNKIIIVVKYKIHKKLLDKPNSKQYLVDQLNSKLDKKVRSIEILTESEAGSQVDIESGDLDQSDVFGDIIN